MRRPIVAIAGVLLLVGCSSRSATPPQVAARRVVLRLQMDSSVIRELQQGSIPAAREISLPLPDGTRSLVTIDPLPECDPVAGQRGFGVRISAGRQGWYVKVVAGAGFVDFIVVGDREAWIYTVVDADAGILEARTLNQSQALCAVDAEAQAKLQLLNVGDTTWPRRWPASPRVFRFAVSATYRFMSRFRDTERVASRNVHMASAFFEKWQNVSLCPVVHPKAIERRDGEIYTGDIRKKRDKAHELFRALDLQFDLGQVFEVGGDAWGEPFSVCSEKDAGRGITSWRTKDPENVWLVVHEAAHQLGATHTFNANFPGRAPESAVELGEGRSVLSYPSNRSDVWFHPLTVAQILTHVGAKVRASPGCGKSIGTVATTAPDVQDRTLVVPPSTQIDLDASARTEATQFAIGELTQASAANTSPPWFYGQPPSSSPLFTFPSYGERLPDRDGELRFMAMARDKDGSIGFGFHTVNVTTPPPPRSERKR